MPAFNVHNQCTFRWYPIPPSGLTVYLRKMLPEVSSFFTGGAISFVLGYCRSIKSTTPGAHSIMIYVMISMICTHILPPTLPCKTIGKRRSNIRSSSQSQYEVVFYAPCQYGHLGCMHRFRLVPCRHRP